MSHVLIAEIQKESVIDWVGKVADVLFLGGCNLRCPYCYNPALVLNRLNAINPIPLESYLNEEKNFHNVVVTGGEPTIHSNLIEMLRILKIEGYSVKLDTNGTNPAIIKDIIAKNLIEYVSLDIKHALEPDKYKKITGGFNVVEEVQETLHILKKSNIPFDCKTTVIKSIHTSLDLFKIALAVRGCSKYRIQPFKIGNCLNSEYNKYTGFSEEKVKMANSIVTLTQLFNPPSKGN